MPLREPDSLDSRLPRRIVLSMSTVLVTNCETIYSYESESFFKSLSPNIIDFIDKTGLLISKEKIKEFIFQLNQNSDLDTDRGTNQLFAAFLDLKHGVVEKTHVLYWISLFVFRIASILL